MSDDPQFASIGYGYTTTDGVRHSVIVDAPAPTARKTKNDAVQSYSQEIGGVTYVTHNAYLFEPSSPEAFAAANEQPLPGHIVAYAVID
jgi:hypothetical protein